MAQCAIGEVHEALNMVLTSLARVLLDEGNNFNQGDRAFAVAIKPAGSMKIEAAVTLVGEIPALVDKAAQVFRYGIIRIRMHGRTPGRKRNGGKRT